MICSRFVSETKLKAEQGLLVFNLGKDLLCSMLGMISMKIETLMVVAY